LENRSLVKYKLIIDEWGGWEPFQSLLRALHDVATRHQTTTGAVALRWVLDQPGVTAAIVGSRNATHLPGTMAALTLSLSDAERAELAAALGDGPGPQGDVYTLEREKGGRHAVIMRYGLNAMATD
jgi:diketogulonate reductase-like aldo/keto reductase